MSYIEGRTVHDADAHVVETPDWVHEYADPAIRERIPPLYLASVKPGEHTLIEKMRIQHADPEYRARDEEEILLRKNWSATGSFIREDRPRALDLLGVQSQLVFNTFMNGYLNRLEHEPDLDFAYGVARAHNRAMLEFCSVDRRLLPTGYVPLADFERAREMAEWNLDSGCKALLVPSQCPGKHSPSHVGLFPVWERAQEAGVPVVFHVGGGGELLSPAYFENGMAPVPDFHGGAENFRSVDYMAIPFPPMQTLSTLIFDGILDRFPRLMIGVIEQGASWVPGWMRQLDSAHDAFRKNEERLQKLSLRASEYVRRQVRVTPYPAEDVGWIAQQAGDEVCLFSTDYPHVEGGRNPVKRFEASMKNLSDAQRQRFYCDNFVELMGSALD
ncbi:MAG: amidohydrolase family protein [Proteobacteria bacterium]|nr:amidohydrolase family protein [Pseudomonadota bacterium]MCZ6785224.1 amidohydrolase family protein [Pseudomonadota bacterium]